MTIPMTPTDLDILASGAGVDSQPLSLPGMTGGAVSDVDSDLMKEAMTVDPTKGKAAAGPKDATDAEAGEAAASEAKESKSEDRSKSEKSAKSAKALKSMPDLDLLADINIMQL